MSTSIMEALINSACKNIEKGYGPFAAAIVKNGRIIVTCSNGVIQNCDPTAHAEIRAIREACKMMNTIDLHECELYTTCEPCPMCFGAIYWASIKKVYYAAIRQDAADAGFDDEFIYTEIEKFSNGDNWAMSKKLQQIKTKNMIKPFEEWKKYPNKKEY